MQGRVKGDNRQSGRTTRMLAAALECALKNDHAFVVIPRGMWEYCLSILNNFAPTSTNHSQRIVSFGTAKIHFLTPDNDVVRKDDSFEVRGIKPEFVFWDHEAIRRKYNHILMRYHAYD